MQITIEDAPPVPLPRRTAIGTCRFRNNVRRSSVWLAPACLALGLACGAISARSLFAQEETNPDGVNQELIDFVVGLLNDEDQEMRAVGLEQVRSELKGAAATKQLLAVLPKLNTAAQVGLTRALGDRGDATARPALIEIVKNDGSETAVKVAAVRSLGMLGNDADLPLLLELLAGQDAALKASARASLIRLPGSETPRALAKAIVQVAAETRVILMEIVVERRAAEAIPELLQSAKVSNVEVRSAAMKALGEMGGPEDLPGMVAGVLKASSGQERDAAEKAVMFVCQRIENADERAIPLLAAMENLSPEDRLRMLSTLGRVGGAAALQVVESKIASSDVKEHKLGVRAICNWPDASIAPRLLELYKSESRAEYREMVLKALIRVAPLPDGRTSEARLKLLKTAMNMCGDDGLRRLVLLRAPAIRTVETLRYVLTYLDQPALAVEAHEAVVELAHHRSLREPNKAEFDAALDLVIAASKDEIVLDRAQRYKKGQTWDRKSVSD